MLDSLIIHHQPKQNTALETVTWSGPVLLFDTCLRRIAISSVDCLAELPSCRDGDMLRGLDAYTFLLEVIAGLHSPVLAETEVLGQFRQQSEHFLNQHPASGYFFQPLVQQLNQDVKLIRQQHLRDLGSQSYGSLCRRLLQDSQRVALLGAGQLAESIWPWLEKPARDLALFCRQPGRQRDWFQSYPQMQRLPLTALSDWQATTQTTLDIVIAAPIADRQLSDWLAGQNCGMIIDLREQADSNSPLAAKAHYWSLADCLQQLQDQSAAAEKRRRDVRAAVATQALNTLNQIHHRPFGWEDLCA